MIEKSKFLNRLKNRESQSIEIMEVDSICDFPLIQKWKFLVHFWSFRQFRTILKNVTESKIEKKIVITNIPYH